MTNNKMNEAVKARMIKALNIGLTYHISRSSINAIKSYYLKRTKPVFTHDCEECTFLFHDFKSGFDVYHCLNSNATNGTFILRYGNQPHENLSYPIDEDGCLMPYYYKSIIRNLNAMGLTTLVNYKT